MYKRSWPTVIISLIAIGVMFLGIGIFYAYYNGIVSALGPILLGLVFIAGGICILCWRIKKRKK